MESPIVQRIRQFLKLKHHSIAEIAEQLEMKQSTLGGQLNGSRGLDVCTLENMVKVLPEISAEWLLRGIEPMERTAPTPDPELKAVCIDQAKEIYRLKLRISELEGKNGQIA